MSATWPPRAVIRKSAGLRTIESALYRGGLGPVAGVDEVGRGACAGPLVVAACVLGPNRLESLAALDDSKKLNEKERAPGKVQPGPFDSIRANRWPSP